MTPGTRVVVHDEGRLDGEHGTVIDGDKDQNGLPREEFGAHPGTDPATFVLVDVDDGEGEWWFEAHEVTVLT